MRWEHGFQWLLSSEAGTSHYFPGTVFVLCNHHLNFHTNDSLP